MALALRNNSTFTCQPVPLTAKNGATILRIVLKAGFAIAGDGELVRADEQPEVVMEDQYWGEPGISSIRYESDIVLDKPHTDLVVNGHARAPKGRPVTQMDVALAYQGRVLKRLRVIGDRVWRTGAVGWRMTAPSPFTEMPITYDRAYGGSDIKGSEARNRSGTGFTSSANSDFEGTPAPNIEFADQLISTLADKPEPAGLGVVSKHWEPRLFYAGTYDALWLEKQFPLLPHDFDNRFFQSVNQAQWIPRPHGGEQVAIQGMTDDGLWRFQLPDCDMKVKLRYRDRTEERLMDLDTILVEPDDRRLILTWHATADIHGDPFRLLEMTIGKPTDNSADCGCRPA